MLRNLVFDMGNVLMEYHPLLPCLRHAQNEEDARAILEALFRAPEWEEKLDACLISEPEMLKIAQDRLPTPELGEVCARVFADYHEDSLFPVAGMDALLRSLHRRGFHLYLLSNVGERIHQYKHRLPGYDLFDGLLFSGDEYIKKPDPAIFRLLLERFGLKAEESLFVDDRKINLDAALSLGMEAYEFLDYDLPSLDAFLKKLPDPV